LAASLGLALSAARTSSAVPNATAAATPAPTPSTPSSDRRVTARSEVISASERLRAVSADSCGALRVTERLHCELLQSTIHAGPHGESSWKSVRTAAGGGPTPPLPYNAKPRRPQAPNSVV